MRRLLLFSFALVLLASCRDNMPPDNSSDPPSEVRGRVWRLESIESAGQVEAVAPEPAITIVFSDVRLHGKGVCNSYGGAYTIQGALLSIADLTWTEMACASGQDLERRYFGALTGVESHVVSAARLRLFSEGGRIVLNYVAIPGDTTERPDTIVPPTGGDPSGPWRLRQIKLARQTIDVDTMPATFIVFRDGTIDGSLPKTGRGGSVRYFGAFRIDSGRIQFTDLRFPYSLDSSSQQYARLLAEADRYHATPARLALYVGRDSVLIYERFRPIPPPEPGWLEGTSWRLVRMMWKEQGRMLVEAPIDSIVVSFMRGRYEGTGICNAYNGEYRHSGTPNDGTISIVTFAATDKACVRGPWEQKYFVVFRESTHYVVTPTELTLASDAGMLEYVRVR